LRFYFLFGDNLTVGLTGALVGLLCIAATGVGWNMTFAMFWGMILGMALAMPVSTIMGIWFGAFEIMFLQAATVGALWSLAALLATYVANAMLRGEVKR
jgi:hypothetical protein